MSVKKDNYKHNQRAHGKLYRYCSNVREDSVAGAFKLFDGSLPREEKKKRIYWKDLNKRPITGLFCVNSPDRIYIGAPGWRSLKGYL